MKGPTELKLYPPSRELARVAEEWEYGSTHSHTEIAEILGIPQQENTYYQAVSDANELLLPKSKMIRNVRGIGYLVVNPDSYEDTSYERVKKSREYLLRACEIAQYAPREKMSPEDRMRFDRYVVGLGTRAALFMREFESKAVISGPMKIQLSERRPALSKKEDP